MTGMGWTVEGCNCTTCGIGLTLFYVFNSFLISLKVGYNTTSSKVFFFLFFMMYIANGRFDKSSLAIVND